MLILKLLPMKTKNLLIKIVIIFFAFTHLNSCGIYRPVSARDFPPEPEKRIQKNLQEGRGFRIMGDNEDKGGNFSFASSNESIPSIVSKSCVGVLLYMFDSTSILWPELMFTWSPSAGKLFEDQLVLLPQSPDVVDEIEIAKMLDTAMQTNRIVVNDLFIAWLIMFSYLLYAKINT